MKILFINPVAAYMRGGGEINDLNLGAALQGKGHDVIHVHAADPGRPAIPYPEGCTAVSVRMPFFYDRALTVPGIAGKAMRAFFTWYFLYCLKRQKAELLRSADLILLTGKPLLSKIKSLTSAKVLLSVRGRNHSYMYPSYRRADGVIFWGGCDEDHPQTLKDSLSSLALNPAVEHDIFRPSKADPATWALLRSGNPKNIALLYVGRLDPVHQVETMIRAAAHAANRHPELVLHLVGDGSEKLRLQEIAERLLPGRVIFHGRLSRERVADLHRAADIFMINPAHTNHPIALMEAVACNSFALAPDLGRVEKIVRGYPFCRLFSPNNQASLNDCLSQTLDERAWENKSRETFASERLNSWEENADAVLAWRRNRKTKLCILCDQSVDIHFPAHFYKVYGPLLRARGYDTTTVAFCRNPEHEDSRRRRDEGAILLQKNTRKGIAGRIIFTLSLLNRLFILFLDPRIAKADVYLVHNDPVLGIFAYLMANSGSKIIYRLTHLVPEEAMICKERHLRIMGWVSRLLRNWLLKRCHYILPTSPVACDIIAEQLPEVRSRMAPLVAMVDADENVPPAEALLFEKKTKELAEKLKEKPCDEWMVYLGTLSPNRELTLMIDALAHLRKTTDRKTGLLVFGVVNRPADLTALQRYAQEKGMSDAVFWADAVTESCLPFVSRLGTIGLSPFPVNSVVRANSPLKTLEYIRSGLPVVGSDIPNHHETIGESKAGLIAENTPVAWTAAAAKLLSETASERKARMEAAHDWLRRHRDLPLACDIIESAIRYSRDAAAKPPRADQMKKAA